MRIKSCWKQIFALVLALFGAIPLATAQTFTTLKSFGILTNITGFNPRSQLVQGPDGTLYGTTAGGEENVAGTLFKVQPDGSGFTVLKWFTNSVEGANPYAGLTLSGGVLYGTTFGGGNSGSGTNGTVFKINTDGTGYTVLKNFTGGDEAHPEASLTLSGGVLYGTTYGVDGFASGTVFKVNTNGTGYTVLKNFTGSGAAQPVADLTVSGGVIYGTTTINWINPNNGAIFKMNTDGTGFTVLKNFSYSDGVNPFAGLTLSGGVLYGTTYYGGSSAFGTVFKMNTNGTGYTVLKSFYNSGGDGEYPQADLTVSGGVIYGTTVQGGSSGYGTVFKLNTDGTGFTVLKSFTGKDGENPYAGLLLSGGVLYGTTYGGGSSGHGTVFQMNTDGTGYAVLKNFTYSDGRNPETDPTVSGGVLYGTTYFGGSSGGGTIFKVNTDGTGYTVLKNFTGTDGANPQADLTLSGDVLYGTTRYGGSSDDGTVFKVNTDGTGYTVLKTFTGSTGGIPFTGLTLSGGVLYGTTYGGGSSDDGTVFKMNTNGTGYTVLKNFTGTDGARPEADLILSGGVLYGTTYYCGNPGYGMVFKVNTDGTGFTVLKRFTGSDGAYPYRGLTLSDGVLYGTTYWGGSSGSGTLFKVNTDGTGFTVLNDFPGSGGFAPESGLTLSGSVLYGTTYTGGDSGYGTVFKVNTDGTGFTVLKYFTGSEQVHPMGLTLSGRVLYGTTYMGGDFGIGTVFSLELNFPIITIQPADQMVTVDSPATFSVTASGGSVQLFYQWQFNGVDISGATNSDYSIASAQFTNAGNYDVVVSDTYGAVTSSVARLSVKPSGVTHWWPGDGNGLDVIGSLNATVQGAATFVSSGQVGGAFTNTGGSADYFSVPDFSLGSQATIEAWVKPGLTNGGYQDVNLPYPRRTAVGAADNCNDLAFGIYGGLFGALYHPPSGCTDAIRWNTPIQTNKWYHLAVTIDGSTARFYVNGSLAGSATTLANYTPETVFRIGAATCCTASGDSFAGAIDEVATYNRALSASELSNIFMYDRSEPYITSQPQSLSVNAGDVATFSVAVSGAGPFAYQWQSNNVNISGATGSSLTIANAECTNAGSYLVIITNTYGAVTSSVAMLSILNRAPVANAGGPYSIALGNPVTLHGEASYDPDAACGDSITSWQWDLNNDGSTDATGATPTVSASTLSGLGMGAGTYPVKLTVTDGFGASDFTTTTLTITNPPVITSQPASRTNTAGTTATFSVTAGGAKPLSYQWRKEGMDLTNGGTISGARTNALTISSVVEGDGGNYNVVITNIYGSVISSNALLTVTLPVILGQGGSGAGFSGGQFGFTLSGPADSSVIIQSSTNLVNWVPLSTNVLNGGTTSFSDPNSTNIQANYYRAILQP